jgi:hypothetical protein
MKTIGGYYDQYTLSEGIALVTNSIYVIVSITQGEATKISTRIANVESSSNFIHAIGEQSRHYTCDLRREARLLTHSYEIRHYSSLALCGHHRIIVQQKVEIDY